MTVEPTITRGAYAGLWRTVPREVAYLLIAYPISIVAFSVTISLFSAGAGTLVTFFIGVLFFIAVLYVARGFGVLELALLRFAGRAAIDEPDWMDRRARKGFFGWLRAVLGNGHYWLYLLYTMVVDFILKTISWTVIVTWISTGLGGITYWFWQRFLPSDDSSTAWVSRVIGVDAVAGRIIGSIVYLVAGAGILLLLPYVSRGLTSMHWFAARALLGRFRTDALEAQVASLAESRGAAHAAEGHSLRRLERDIHDGPQQRLVRLQMDLAAAERQLDTDPEKARGLIAEAMQQSKDALEELRALSRGFAPPLLLDRGLVAALESAAARNSIPTTVVSELPDDAELPEEIERNAYFVATEAMANAGKHSGASQVTIRVWMRVEELTWLDLVVSDDGHGGATVVESHGIAGLQERLRGVGGSLEVVSPEGGPTSVIAHLPLVAPVVSSVVSSSPLAK